MDIENRKWWIKNGDAVEGPIDEEDFQSRLRAGSIPLGVMIKSDAMVGFEPLLKVVSTDDSFKRPSTAPPKIS